MKYKKNKNIQNKPRFYQSLRYARDARQPVLNIRNPKVVTRLNQSRSALWLKHCYNARYFTRFQHSMTSKNEAFHKILNASNSSSGYQSLRSWNCRRIAAILRYNTMKCESLMALEDMRLMYALHISVPILNLLYRTLDSLRSSIFSDDRLQSKFVVIDVPRIFNENRAAELGVDDSAVKSVGISGKDYNAIVTHLRLHSDLTGIYTLFPHIRAATIDRLLDRLFLHPVLEANPQIAYRIIHTHSV
jgi:hypothetical protein